MGEVVLSFWCPGRPKTKGSLNMIPGRKCRCSPRCAGYLGRGHVEENVVGSKDWRRLMAYSAKAAMALRHGISPRFPLVGPVEVCAVFVLPVIDVTQDGCGDKDKLERNLLDALQDAGVYRNDVQVVGGQVVKISYAVTSQPPGVDVRVLLP